MSYTPFIDPTKRPNDLNPEAFGGVGGSVFNQTLFSQWDLYDPQELVEIFERHSHSVSYRLFLASMGFAKGSSAPTLGHYEAPWKHDNITIGSIITAAGGAGNEMVVALATTDMYDPGLTANGSARKASYPVAKDELYFPNYYKARIKSKDVTTDPHRLTLQPMVATEDLDSIVTAGAIPFISDNSHGEGTGLPAGRTPRLIKYSNTFQIVKDYSGATGSSLSNKAYVNPLPGKPGSFYLRVEDDMFWRMEGNVAGALIWGQIKDIEEYNAKLGHDVPVTGTEGLIKFVLTNSAQDIYVPGAYALSDFDQTAKYFEDERIGKRDLLYHQGFDIYQETENVLLDLYNPDVGYFLSRGAMGFDDGETSLDSLQPMQASDWQGNIGFRAMRKSGYKAYFKLLHEFNDIKKAGGTGFDFRKWNVITPLGYMMNKANNTKTPTLGYEWKQLNDYSREFVVNKMAGVGVAGAAQGVPISAVSEYDVLECGVVSEVAAHFSCANQILIQKP